MTELIEKLVNVIMTMLLITAMIAASVMIVLIVAVGIDFMLNHSSDFERHMKSQIEASQARAVKARQAGRDE